MNVVNLSRLVLLGAADLIQDFLHGRKLFLVFSLGVVGVAETLSDLVLQLFLHSLDHSCHIVSDCLVALDQIVDLVAHKQTHLLNLLL
jgi:regulator of sigma D